MLLCFFLTRFRPLSILFSFSNLAISVLIKNLIKSAAERRLRSVAPPIVEVPSEDDFPLSASDQDDDFSFESDSDDSAPTVEMPRRRPSFSLAAAAPAPPVAKSPNPAPRQKKTPSASFAPQPKVNPRKPRRASAPATTGKGSSVPNQLVNFMEGAGNQSVYSKMVADAYQSKSYLGMFEVPVVLLSSAAVARHLCTRDLNEQHVQELMSTFRSHTSGLLVRDTLKVVLIPNPDFAGATSAVLNRTVKKLVDTPDHVERLTLLREALKAGQLIAVTIAGNHGREACFRLISLGELSRDLTVRVDVFVKLDAASCKAIGFVDNLVSSSTLEYSLLDKVTMIRDISNDPCYLSDGLLTSEALRICVEDIMYKNSSAKKSETDRNKRLKSASPFLKACRVPDELWPIVSQALATKKITQGQFRTFHWGNYPEKQKAIFESFIANGHEQELKTKLELVNLRAKLIPAMQQIYKSLSIDDRQENTFEEFLDLINEEQNLDVIVIKFKRELKAVNARGVFADVRLTNLVKMILKRKNENASQDHSAALEVEGLNAAGKQSVHIFMKGDCKASVTELSSDPEQEFGLIVLDPPFGCLKDVEWDVAWSDAYWDSLLNELGSKFPKSPLLIFMEEQQLETIFMFKRISGYINHRLYSWLKVEHNNHLPGRVTYPVNHILLLWGTTPLSWQPTSTFAQNGNFLATLRCESYSLDGTPVNETSKPVLVLRSFIASLCNSRSKVLDLCCGSGSTAIAAASLGIDSVGVDNRSSQVAACVERVKQEAISPSWYPEPGVIHKYQALRNQLRASTIKADDPENFVPRKTKKTSTSRSARPARPIHESLEEDQADVDMFAEEDSIVAADAVYFPPDPEEIQELMQVDDTAVTDGDEESEEEEPNQEDLNFIVPDNQDDGQEQVQETVLSDEEAVQLSEGSEELLMPSPPSPEAGQKRRAAPRKARSAASKKPRR